jgi:hypothetical protein
LIEGGGAAAPRPHDVGSHLFIAHLRNGFGSGAVASRLEFMSFACATEQTPRKATLTRGIGFANRFRRVPVDPFQK